jgi:hypothetical protein
MKIIKVYQLTNEADQPWAVNFNCRDIVFNSYGAALSEARFLLHYCAFVVLRGESDEGAMIIRVDETVNPETQLREQVETILEQNYCKGVIQMKLEKWS